MIRNLTGKEHAYGSVFFDLDGTITASGEGCLNGVRYMFQRIGAAENDENRLKAFIGPSVKRHLQRYYGFSEQETENAYKYYREYYTTKGIFENRLYEGIREAIENIRNSGKAVYVATSKPEYQAIQILERFDMLNLFSGVFAAKHEIGVFEKDEVLEGAVAALGDVKDAVMVGDRSYDILGGKHVGFDTVGVLYGYGDLNELTEAGCDYIVDSVQDLSELLGRR